jgi:glyoxylase-like metal-dependent hydrolase (beta-lactamase superfamily II)
MVLRPQDTPTPNFGDLWIGRIEDFQAPSAGPETVFPQYDPAGWDRGRRLIPESSWAKTGSGTVTRFGTWIVVADGKVVLVDTSWGNGKSRPHVPAIDNLHTDYLDRLAAIGVSPDVVDAVVVTHFHPDHIGWNTTLVDGAWQPTFPNATYYFPRREVDFWQPKSGATRVGEVLRENSFEDSIAPVIDSGMAEIWDGHCFVLPQVSLEPAPGHTPGNSVVKLQTAQGKQAVFTGDILHSAAQVANPHWCHRFCEDQTVSAGNRRAVLNWATENDAVVLAAHFGEGSGFTVGPFEDSFTISGWHEFPSVT